MWCDLIRSKSTLPCHWRCSCRSIAHQKHGVEVLNRWIDALPLLWRPNRAKKPRATQHSRIQVIRECLHYWFFDEVKLLFGRSSVRTLNINIPLKLYNWWYGANPIDSAEWHYLLSVCGTISYVSSVRSLALLWHCCKNAKLFPAISLYLN